MNATMMALSISGFMICLGMIIRTKSKTLGKLLIPVNVIAGILGLIYMNTINNFLTPLITENEFNSIVNQMFTFSFISIGLASVSDKKEKIEKNSGGSTITKGSFGMGLQWSLLFGLTAVIGVLVIYVIGGLFGMDPMYGILIPYAFCQGPGQAAVMGEIFEEFYGMQNAQMVGITFAVTGFISAFAIGVPIAKYGLRKKLQVSNASISETVERGFYYPEEQQESMGKVTTHSGNLETLSFHVALMGICYIIAVILGELCYYIPEIGPAFGNMLFIWGMVGGSIVKKVLAKLDVEYLLNKPLQNKITGFTSDFLVVCAFMAIKVSTVLEWIIPIIIVSIVIAILTAVVCFYFTSRLGSDHDFERSLGMYGMCTGTTPTGIALVRIVDPKLQTATATELGMTNLFMMTVTPVTLAVTFLGAGTIELSSALLIILCCCVVYLAILKICKFCNKPTFNLIKGEKYPIK
ncbi:MAG: sodium/glutamate symporter [Clostridia bacterium]